MSNIQSFANQLGWCIQTQSYLNELNSEIRYVSDRYAQSVDMLRKNGHLEEMLMRVQEMQSEFEESANDLIQHIEMEHLDYIENQSKSIQKTLSAL